MRLRGAGMGTGTAIGAAAVVRLMSGVPLPPEIPPRVLAERAGGRNSELPDVIVVAEEFRNALAISGAIGWANVVGIAAERSETNPLPCPFPAVVGLSNLLETVADDMLLLLDAAAGILLADPDPVAIAQYQAEAEHLAPKRRFFLDEAHLPAQALDGHTIEVFAEIETSADVDAAMTGGADGLYILPHCELFDVGERFDKESAQRNALFALMERTQGKPLCIDNDWEWFPGSLVEAAARAEITIIRPLEFQFEYLGIGELFDELQTAKKECEDNQVVCAMPRIGVMVGGAGRQAAEAAAKQTRDIAVQGANYIFFALSPENRTLDFLSAVKNEISAALENKLAAYFFLTTLLPEENLQEIALPHLIGAGVSTVIAPSHRVSEAKTLIRSLNYADCRAEVVRLINERKSGV